VKAKKTQPTRKDPAVDAPLYAAEAANAEIVWKGNRDLRGMLRPLVDIDPDPENLRLHGEGNLEAIRKSFGTFGQAKPIVIWRSSPDARPIAIAGNGTMESLRALGWTHIAVTEFEGTYAAARAYAFIDNAAPLSAEWVTDVREKVETINTAFADENPEWDAAEISFDAPEEKPAPRPNTKGADGKNTREREGSNQESDEDPDALVSSVPQIKPGDLFKLGAHRLICGDSRDVATLARLMGDERAAFLHADPPYGLNKDGVENDDLHGDRLDAFQVAWWNACRPSIVDNGSAFVWGNAEDLWRFWWRYLAPAEGREFLSMRSEIVWDKIDGPGMCSDEMRSWAITTERAIFFMFGEQKLNIDSANFWAGWEPLRAALAAETERAGWTQKDLHRITGTFMAKHWITRSQWTFITEAHYLKLQEAGREMGAFQFDYAAVREVYEKAKIEHDREVKEAFYAGRSFFDNAHDTMGEVWSFPRVLGEERHGHATPKPVAMISRALKSCCPSGGIVL